MRHEVVNFVPAVLGVGVGVQRGQQGRATLDTHAQVKRPTEIAKLHPGPELLKAEPLLGLGNGSPADAAED